MPLNCHGTPPAAVTFLSGLLFSCGRTPIEPLTVRDDICGDREHESLCDSALDRFASEVLRYDRTVAGDVPPQGGAFSDPAAALGSPDFSFSLPNTAVAIGNGGVLELGFGDCWLTNGGDGEADVIVHEAGPLEEAIAVSVRPAGATASRLEGISADGFVAIGTLAGPGGLDIDLALPGFDECDLRFDAIRIDDDPTMGGWFTEGTGADIDAVELLELAYPSAD